MCLQREDSSIQFWIYVCPFNAGFSTKAAVAKLRISSKNASAWGTIERPTDEPLILQLVKEIGKTDLPTEVTTMLKEIVKTNLAVEEKHIKLKEQNAIKIYSAAS